MYEISKFSTVNIREYLAESKDAEIGEDVLLRIFSDFSCPINPDVEQFLKERAIEFRLRYNDLISLPDCRLQRTSPNLYK